MKDFTRTIIKRAIKFVNLLVRKNKMEELKKGYFGAIEQYNKQDFQIAGSELDLDLLKENENNFWKYKIAYNQFYINNSMCTIIAGCGILSNYFNYVFSKEELLNLVELAKKEKPPFRDGVGWYIYKGVDLTRNYWNKKNPNKQVITYRVRTGSWLFYELLKKGYHLQGGFKGNREFSEDKKDNCKIDKVVNVGNPTYGHSIYFAWKDGKVYTIDSYKGFGCNVYEITNFKELVNNGVYFKYSYVFIPKNMIMTQLEKDIEAVKFALEKGITKDKRVLIDIEKGNYTPKVQTIIMLVRAIQLLKEGKI